MISLSELLSWWAEEVGLLVSWLLVNAAVAAVRKAGGR